MYTLRVLKKDEDVVGRCCGERSEAKDHVFCYRVVVLFVLCVSSTGNRTLGESLCYCATGTEIYISVG
jgi:hypothetical protein